MAIYSLHHGSVGRSTHAAGTAGAHIDYIARARACREVLGARMPLPAPSERGGETRAWLDAQEAGERKNGRVIDKLMLALPRELTAAQRAELVRGFAEEVTQGRAPWLAALHADAGNPHAHLVVRDKDPQTGKRVAGLSEKGSTERLREAWERAANAALERAGREERIDRRTLAEQGVERAAQIHVGPRVAAMERQGKRVQSRERTTGRGRVVRWPEIDRGRSRAAHNADLRDMARTAPQRPVQRVSAPTPARPFPPARKSPVRPPQVPQGGSPIVQSSASPPSPPFATSPLPPEVQARVAEREALARLAGLPEVELAREVQRLMPEPVEVALLRRAEVRRASDRVGRIAEVETRFRTIAADARRREGEAHYYAGVARSQVRDAGFGLGRVLLAAERAGKALGVGKGWLQRPELRELEGAQERHGRRATWAEAWVRRGGPVERIRTAALEALRAVEAVARREIERVQEPARRLYELAAGLLTHRQAERERQAREQQARTLPARQTGPVPEQRRQTEQDAARNFWQEGMQHGKEVRASEPARESQIPRQGHGRGVGR